MLLRKSAAMLTRYFFRRFRSRAAKIILNPWKVKKILDTAEKDQHVLLDSLGRLPKDFTLLTGIVRDWIRGTYRNVPVKSIVVVLGALLYLISPIDAIPDFIPVVGYLDDAFVIGLAIRQVRADLDRYGLWKQSAANPSA